MERRADCPSAAVVICFPLSSFSLPLTRAQEELFLLFGYFSNAAVNLRVLVVMQIYVFISLGHIYTGMELLGHMFILCLDFLEITKLFQSS